MGTPMSRGRSLKLAGLGAALALLAGCAASSDEATGSDEDELTSLTARQRKLTFEGFLYVEPRTSDSTAAFKFYSELFGWKIVEEMDAPMGKYRVYGVGDKSMGGMMTTPKGTPMPPMWLFRPRRADRRSGWWPPQRRAPDRFWPGARSPPRRARAASHRRPARSRRPPASGPVSSLAPPMTTSPPE